MLFLITDLERSRKSTITNCFSFFDIPIRSVSKLSSNMVKVGKFKKKLTYPAFPTSEAFLKHFLSEFGKNKGSLLFYFFEIFPNMILKVLKNQVEIFHFYQYSYFSTFWKCPARDRTNWNTLTVLQENLNPNPIPTHNLQQIIFNSRLISVF